MDEIEEQRAEAGSEQSPFVLIFVLNLSQICLKAVQKLPKVVPNLSNIVPKLSRSCFIEMEDIYRSQMKFLKHGFLTEFYSKEMY